MKDWQDGHTEQIASDRRYWIFQPGAAWHGFHGYSGNQYFLDPMKLMLITPALTSTPAPTKTSASRAPSSPNSCVSTASSLKNAT